MDSQKYGEFNCHKSFFYKVHRKISYTLPVLCVYHHRIVVSPRAVKKVHECIAQTNASLHHCSCHNLLGHKFFVMSPKWLQDNDIPFKVVSRDCIGLEKETWVLGIYCMENFFSVISGDSESRRVPFNLCKRSTSRVECRI